MVGLVIPPPKDKGLNETIASQLADLEKVASTHASKDRGDFKTVTYGIQKGGGSQVSSNFKLANLADLTADPYPMFNYSPRAHCLREAFQNSRNA